MQALQNGQIDGLVVDIGSSFYVSGVQVDGGVKLDNIRDVVVAGAGIAGVSTAFHLMALGVDHVVVCDPLAPLTLTSDKSTECYRNWWPGPGDAMVALSGRSITLSARTAVFPSAGPEGALPDPARLSGQTATLFGERGPGSVEAVLIVLKGEEDPVLVADWLFLWVTEPGHVRISEN
mgnify:CR=1 FL=1